VDPWPPDPYNARKDALFDSLGGEFLIEISPPDDAP
jgi:hypothetical protein